MWLTVAIAAIGAGVQIFSQVRQNNALKSAGADALTQAEADTELSVLKADAAYLGALANNAETQQATEAQKAQLEANQKRLTVGFVIVGTVIVLVVFIAFKNRNS